MEAQGDERRFVFTVGEGRYQLLAEAVLYDDSVLVHLSGGERPHVGAAAAAAPGQGAQCLSFPGHREGEWAARFAGLLAEGLSRNAVVTAGVHIEDAERWEIERLTIEAERLFGQILAAIRE